MFSSPHPGSCVPPSLRRSGSAGHDTHGAEGAPMRAPLQSRWSHSSRYDDDLPPRGKWAERCLRSEPAFSRTSSLAKALIFAGRFSFLGSGVHHAPPRRGDPRDRYDDPRDRYEEHPRDRYEEHPRGRYEERRRGRYEHPRDRYNNPRDRHDDPPDRYDAQRVPPWYERRGQPPPRPRYPEHGERLGYRRMSRL